MRLITGLVLALSPLACSVPDKVFSAPGTPGIDAGGDPPPAVDAGEPAPPDTAITVKPPAADNSTTVSFEFTSTASDATFECALDSAGFSACQTPASFGGLIDGAHVFRVRAVDSAGRADPSPAEYTWTIDTSTPDTVISSSPGSLVNGTSAQFAFSSPNAGAGATYECLLDTGSFASCSSPRLYSSLGEGSHTFKVRVRNATGTYDPTPAVRFWTIDVTPPDTTVASGPPSPNRLGLTAFDFSSNEGGVTYECSLDGAAFTGCSDPFKKWIDSGSHTLKVRARDGAGNVDGSPASYSWTSALANLAFIAHGNTTNLGGLAGGDNLCASAAQAAGFQGTYRAWLSTTTVNAVDRLGTARGWVRPDGKPFADTIANLVAGKIYYPLALDAAGVFTDYVIMTGTGADGKYNAAHGACLDWTSIDNTATAAAGLSTRTSRFWTQDEGGTIGCGTFFGDIYCLGIDQTTQITPPPPTGRIAFVSATKWLPGGGLASADAVCASEASAAGLAGTFKAALATSTAGALARFSATGAPWVRVDGAAITATIAAMFDPSLSYLDTSINVTAAGAYVSEGALFTDLAWSGPRLLGASNTCVDWTDATSAHNGAAAFNASTQIATEFSNSYPFPCSAARHLFCLQQ